MGGDLSYESDECAHALHACGGGEVRTEVEEEAVFVVAVVEVKSSAAHHP
jgi:hypothetical protein